MLTFNDSDSRTFITAFFCKITAFITILACSIKQLSLKGILEALYQKINILSFESKFRSLKHLNGIHLSWNIRLLYLLNNLCNLLVFGCLRQPFYLVI